jgi:hypothetical protein
LPRYELLLKELIKNTEQDHVDFQDLCQALFKIQEVNKKINESKKMADNLSYVVEISVCVANGNLISRKK